MEDILNIFTVEEFEQLYKDTFGTPKEWYSSAKRLDDAISNHGFNISLKFFHNYKLPNTKENMEQRSETMKIITSWKDNLIEIQKIRKEKIILSKELESKLENRKKFIESEINLCFEYITSNNSELKSIETKEIVEKLHLIRGAIYGYSPENITFFIKNYTNDSLLNQTFSYKKTLNDEFGIDSGFLRITKEQGDLLISQLTSEKNRINKIKNSPIDKTGYLDFMRSKEMD